MDPVRFEDIERLNIVGLMRRYERNQLDAVPGQWNRLASQRQFINGRVGNDSFGVWYDVLSGGGAMNYMTGYRIGDFAPVHPELAQVVIGQQRYAVFAHAGDVSQVRKTVDAAFSKWLPKSGYSHHRFDDDAPDFLERYVENAAGDGVGAIEVWIPVQQ